MKHTSYRSFLRFLLLTRAAFFAAVLFVLDRTIDLGTSPWFLSVGAILGIFFTAHLAYSNVRGQGFVAIVVVLSGVFYLGAALIGSTLSLFSTNPLISHNILDHSNLFLGTFLLASLSTWAFFRSRLTITLEMLILALGGIYIVSAHRNLQFQVPKFVNLLAWQFGMSPLVTLIILGGGLGTIILSYLYMSTILPWPITLKGENKVEFHRGRRQLIFSTLTLASILFIFYLIGGSIYSRYSDPALLANGVSTGIDSKEGLSPLTFQSALGSTNQPAALVRLEGDYKENPFSPMLYLRESALSKFNGHEIVQANNEYDTDVPGNRPGTPFKGKEEPDLTFRTPVVQSIFLLADHKVSFALDYPIALTLLKNPKPDRFKLSYRSYSMAPAFSLKDLEKLPVGNPSWDEKTKVHYLETHPDQRYTELAHQIVDGLGSVPDIVKATFVAQYISDTSIYTLTPRHKVSPDEDQVAPFLFGDHRGYCVHFAHALVYMFRSLGIPARIGTGYLTDLSQARDGHVLLRMGDRHAWAEVYVHGRGWVPFDVQPAQVESHADLNVDKKLLEELMGMIDPGEEILPKDLTKDEKNVTEPLIFPVPSLENIGVGAAILFILFILSKLFIRFGWILNSSPSAKLRRAYISMVSLLYDLGFSRELGETREEFRERISDTFERETLSITYPLKTLAYNKKGEALGDIATLLKEDFSSLRYIPRWKRILAFLNPASIFSYFGRRRW